MFDMCAFQRQLSEYTFHCCTRRKQHIVLNSRAEHSRYVLYQDCAAKIGETEYGKYGEDILEEEKEEEVPDCSGKDQQVEETEKCGKKTDRKEWRE